MGKSVLVDEALEGGVARPLGLFSRVVLWRGVDVGLLTRPATPRTHPLLASIYPRTLLGPVFVRSMLIDDHTALVGGPDDAFGNRVVWRTHDQGAVRELQGIWDDTAPLSTARERMRLLFDPGTFEEMGLLAGAEGAGASGGVSAPGWTARGDSPDANRSGAAGAGRAGEGAGPGGGRMEATCADGADTVPWASSAKRSGTGGTGLAGTRDPPEAWYHPA